MRPIKPYAHRGLVLIAIVAVLAVATSVAIEIQSIYHQADVGEISRLEASAIQLSDRYLTALHGRTPVSEVVNGTANGIRLSVLDTKGISIADSQFDLTVVPGRMEDAAVQQAVTGGRGFDTAYRVESGRRERVFCTVVRDAGTIVAFALASSPADLTWQTASKTLSWAVPLLVAASAAWFMISLLIARAAVKPVADLADALEKRSLGGLTGLAMRANITELGRVQKASYVLLQENALLAERERSRMTALASIMDSVPQAIAIIDDAGVILSANALFDNLFGQNGEPAAGRRFAELVTLPECLTAIDLCIRENRSQAATTEDRGHSYSYLVRRIGTGENGDRHILVILEDVTEAVALPRIKADFVTNASHELKTPLTAIRGYLELLHEEPGNLHYLDIIERNVDRLIALSSDISLLSRLENTSPDIEPIDMAELEHDLMELFEKQSREAGVPLIFSVGLGGQSLYADRLMLLQLFINLIENAYHFTETGTITVSSTADTTHVILSVTDTGQGIAARELPHIFERFYSRSNGHGRPGTGLGLAIVKRIVLAHNGTINVKSSPGKGTSFVIRIPRNLRAREEAERPQGISENLKEEP